MSENRFKLGRVKHFDRVSDVWSESEMNISTYLQHFENSLASYTGDDLLDPWDRFLELLEKKVPAGDSGMLQVFDAVVQRFLGVDRYANDIRYVNHCIRCASYLPDPIALFSLVFSKGVGTRTAALYVAWARQFEQRGMKEQADAVYQRAVENQAQPADTVLHEYRQFQSRAQLPVSAGRTLLQNSTLTNQMASRSVDQNQAPDCPLGAPARRMVNIVSRSETSESLALRPSCSLPTVSEYTKDALLCEGSELSFEEVRAERYFQRLREEKKKQQRETMELQLRQQEERVHRMKLWLEEADQELDTQVEEADQELDTQPLAAETSSTTAHVFAHSPPDSAHVFAHHPPDSAHTFAHHPPDSADTFAHPPPANRLSSRRSLGLRLHAEPTLAHRAPSSVLPGREPEAVVEPPVSSDQMNVFLVRRPDVLHQSCGASGLSATHLDRSLVPEPEDKLDVSQGGTANVSHVTPNTSLGFFQATPSRLLPSPTVNTREALGVIMDMFQAPTFLEEPFSGTSALHDAEKNRAGGEVCSAPRPPTTAPFTIYQDEEQENCSSAAPVQRPKPARALAEGVLKVDRPNETSPDLVPDESTMWGPRYNSLVTCPNSTTDFALLAQFVSTPFTHKITFNSNFYQDQDGDGADENVFIQRQTNKLSPIMEQSPSDVQDSGSAVAQLPPSVRQGTMVGEGLTSTTLVQPPPAALSFRDHTLYPAESSSPAGPGLEVCPQQDSVRPRAEPFKILEDFQKPAGPEPDQKLDCDVPMSPCPRKTADTTSTRTLDVPMSPEQPGLCADVPMSPQQNDAMDEPMTMSPARGARPADGVQLVPDPWDNNLISDLLDQLSPPLTSDPHFFTWQGSVPKISPKASIFIGEASLRVDCVLGQGAFATVYQATDPVTLKKMVLKVQKPANPWEFYIKTQLDARLQPRLRHLFSGVRSTHLFHDGSVLLGELHRCGTLLNAVNCYKSQGVKVMPPPLVLYFAVCMLHMVEQLHAAHIVHADIKPDNFMLGDRFLETECLDLDSVDHGLVLIDFGQSIDMKLFPEGTAFTARCLTSGFQCTEMLSGKPWTYQTDYFGLAGTVFCLLFGSYMQVKEVGGVWKTTGVFKRVPHGDLWVDFFHTLLNVPDCGSLPSLQNLRQNLLSALQQNYSSKLLALKKRLVIQLLQPK